MQRQGVLVPPPPSGAPSKVGRPRCRSASIGGSSASPAARPGALSGPRRGRLLACAALLAALPATAQDPPPPQVPVALSPRAASYAIDVRLDPESKMLAGRQVLTWRNLRRTPTGELRFHLYWNAWRNNRSTWMLEDRFRGRSDRNDPIAAADWGWIRVRSARLLGGDGAIADLTPSLRHEAPDDGNEDDRTVLVVDLPAAVAPGEGVRVELVWEAKIPRTFARTGFRGDFYFIAHWFPKLGVFEETGWNCHQYHAGTEYFADYGVYDVSMTVPSSFVLGATGREIERRDNGDGTATHRYHQEDVHAFTWTASPDYRVLTGRFEAPGLPPVDLRLLIQPEHLDQAERHFAATRAALELFGRWYGPYPYGHLTIVDPAWGSGAGGMEYPTLFTAGTRWLNPLGGGSPEGVTIHEAGHQFWYGIVGNNEFEHAWLDEGLNTFSTIRVEHQTYGPRRFMRRYFTPPGTDVEGFLPLLLDGTTRGRDIYDHRLERYRPDATSDSQSTPSYLYFPETGASLSYSKTALWLGTLERYLGWETLRAALAAFFERWKFRHPAPEDFFAVVNEVSGRDLGWYFEQVYTGSDHFDYAVERVASEPLALEGWEEDGGELVYRGPAAEGAAAEAVLYRTEVVVRRLGGGIFPVDVLLTFEDGSEVRHRWNGRYRWKLFVEERPARLVSAEVDPDGVLLLDLDRTNNSRRLEPAATRPAVKWATRWMLWLQDYLHAFAFFGGLGGPS